MTYKKTARRRVAAQASRCEAAHFEDPTGCDGPAVVRVLDQTGAAATGCVHHAARLYASLERPRVRPLPGQDAAALSVYYLAQALPPFAWTHSPAPVPQAGPECRACGGTGHEWYTARDGEFVQARCSTCRDGRVGP